MFQAREQNCTKWILAFELIFVHAGDLEGIVLDEYSYMHCLIKVTLTSVSKSGVIFAFIPSGTSDPYCRFKLGNEKYKSKHCKETLNPQWKEHFDLKFFADTDMILEVSVYDRDIRKDEFMGRYRV